MMNLKKKDLIGRKWRTGSPMVCPRFYRREGAESIVRCCIVLYDHLVIGLSSLLALVVEVCASVCVYPGVSCYNLWQVVLICSIIFFMKCTRTGGFGTNSSK